MNDVPRTRSDYAPEGLVVVRGACLHLATCLGDYWDDLVVVGGYVPTLLIPARDGIEEHCGTLDVDVGLSLGVVEDGRYQEIARRFRQSRYEPDRKDTGEEAKHRWRLAGAAEDVTVDFLIQNPDDGVEAGRPFHLAPGFAPIRNDAMEAAFADRVPVELEGETSRGEHVRRTIQVCGPAAFVVMKAHALGVRGLPKDAFDLYYVVRNYGDEGPTDVAGRWERLRSLPAAVEAVRILEAEFATDRSLGPKRVARFLEQDDDEEVLADALGFVRRLLDLMR